MDYSTIGVISTPDGRSQRDLEMLKAFSCKRQPRDIPKVVGDGIGILGSDIEERSIRDKQMAVNFSCSSRENYSDQMIYPRSEKDMAMLREFNGPCQEKLAKQNFANESYCRGCPCGCNGGRNCQCRCKNCPYCHSSVENYCGSSMPEIQRLNYNPYNSSSNIKYVSLQ